MGMRHEKRRCSIILPKYQSYLIHWLFMPHCQCCPVVLVHLVYSNLFWWVEYYEASKPVVESLASTQALDNSQPIKRMSKLWIVAVHVTRSLERMYSTQMLYRCPCKGGSTQPTSPVYVESKAVRATNFPYLLWLTCLPQSVTHSLPLSARCGISCRPSLSTSILCRTCELYTVSLPALLTCGSVV